MKKLSIFSKFFKAAREKAGIESDQDPAAVGEGGAPGAEEEAEPEGSEGSEGADDSAQEEGADEEASAATPAWAGDLFKAIGALGETVKAQQEIIDQLQGSRSEEIEESASQRAVEITSEQGVPPEKAAAPDEDAASGAPKSRAEFFQTYNSIKDSKERAQYWDAHFNTLGRK